MPPAAERPRTAVPRRVRRDRWAIALFVVVATVASVVLEAFESYAVFSARYERYELDEIASLLAILPLALAAYIVRRHADMGAELAARVTLEHDLVWSAEHDALTGLPNRRLLTRKLAEALAPGAEGSGLTGMLLLDLDHFKEVNDTLGHHVGDELLRQVGGRLAGAVRPQDTVARMGGDEFAVLLTGLDTPEEAMDIAERMHDCLSTPVLLHELSLLVEGSLGVALAPLDADGADLLLQRADIAMYDAKSHQTRIARFCADSITGGPERLALLSDLRRALDRDELVLHYQPKVHLSLGRVTGVEALVRWEHPQRGLLAPDLFIPAAEQTGLMRPLLLRVLDLALGAVTDWRADGLDLTVAVNVSARNLLDLSLPTDVAQALARHGLPGSVLELEITETVAMADPARALQVLTSLHRDGIVLSIDDYGTGHCSLGYLQRLPVSQLKIDRSFVTTMTTDASNAVIVRSTIELARHLGLDVVAEGVEDTATVRVLAELGCHSAQGYGLARPAPAEAVPALIGLVQDLVRLHTDPTGPAAPAAA